ncbi:hypothetical protein ACLKA6_007040, partial [Drosophila palustris]
MMNYATDQKMPAKRSKAVQAKDTDPGGVCRSCMPMK